MNLKNYGLIACTLDKGEIDKFDSPELLGFLRGLLEDPKVAYNKLNLIITGYDNDDRQLWEIPEAKDYLNFLMRSFPYFFFFLNRDIPSLQSPFKLLLLSYLPVTSTTIVSGKARIELDLTKASEFFDFHFRHMNELFDKCEFSDEENIKATEEIFALLVLE